MIDYQQKQTQATAKINQYGATISRTIDTTIYADSITGAIVSNPVAGWDGQLINPITGNLVTGISSSIGETFKGVEETHSIQYGDFSSELNYVGSLVAEGTRVFMVSADISISMGDILTIAGIEYNVNMVEPFSPGDIEIYKMVGVKR